MASNDTLFEHQFGFQPKKTTSMAILDIYAKIVESIENNDIACFICIKDSK